MKNNNDYKYIDVTKEWLRNARPNSHEITIDNIFIDDFGIKHPIPNQEKANIPNKFSEEYRIANIIKRKLGGNIHLQPRIETAKGYKGIVSVPTPDYKWNGIKWDLKTPTTKGKFDTSIERFFKKVKKVKKQSRKYIINFKHYSQYSDKDIIDLAQRTLNNPHRNFIENLILIKDDEIIKIYVRKQKELPSSKGSTRVQM